MNGSAVNGRRPIFLQVRIFLSSNHENASSSEVAPAAQSSPSPPPVQSAVKRSLRSLSLAVVRHGQRAKPLRASLKEWGPQRAPALVPIPIRTGGRAPRPSD